jgi:DnaJ-class molecular chaperone
MGFLQRLEGEGSTNPDMLPGDLVFKLVTLPHKKFARNGNDLEYFMTISLLEALVGFRTEITHLDGHKVPVGRDEITPPGFVLSIPGEGMPHHNTPSVKVVYRAYRATHTHSRDCTGQPVCQVHCQIPHVALQGPAGSAACNSWQKVIYTVFQLTG